MVGLGNVDNTSDASKPISTAVQTALDAKVSSTSLTSTLPSGYVSSSSLTSDVIKFAATLASPTLQEPFQEFHKAMVGLGDVKNTYDINKPASTAVQLLSIPKFK
jgi:hypothetical protein